MDKIPTFLHTVALSYIYLYLAIKRVCTGSIKGLK